MFTPATCEVGPGVCVMTADDDKNVLGKRLRMLREERGLGVRQLALKAGVSHSAISQIESGERPYPRYETKKKLADALGVTVEELEGRAIVGTEDIEQGTVRFSDPEFVRQFQSAPEEVKEDVRRYLAFLLERQKQREQEREN